MISLTLLFQIVADNPDSVAQRRWLGFSLALFALYAVGEALIMLQVPAEVRSAGSVNFALAYTALALAVALVARFWRRATRRPIDDARSRIPQA